MGKYYEEYKILILAAALVGVYIPIIEKLYGKKCNVKPLKLILVIPAVSFSVFLFSTLKYQIFDEDEPENKVYGYTILLFSFFTGSTMYAFNYYKNDFVRLFESWDLMFQEELFIEDRKELMRKSREKTNKWLKVCGSISVVSCLAYSLSQYFIPEKEVKHPTGIPYRHQSPDFELVNTLDLIVATFGFALLVTFDTTTMAFLSMEEAQLIHLKKSLGRIIDVVSVSDYGTVRVKSETTEINSDECQMKRNFEQVEINLRTWLSHHQQLLSLHDEFQRVFSIPLAIKFSVFVLMICLIFFLMFAGRFNVVDVFISFVFCSINYTVFYVNVLYADSIAELNETIFEDAFGKDWYIYPRHLTTAFHIIQMRSYRPVRYLAFKKYTLNSSTFLSILTSAYSIFTFLLQTNKKKIKVLEMRTSQRMT